MKNKFPMLAAFILIVFFACKKDETPQPTTNQSQTSADIHFTVLRHIANNNEPPIVGATIKAYSSASDRASGTNPIRAITTGTNGQAIMYTLPYGTYFIRVTCSYGGQNLDITITNPAVAAYETVVFY
jgi:Prealbumin-like fold domain